MKYSSLVQRISGESVAAWDIHYAACQAQERGENAIILSIGDPDFATDDAGEDTVGHDVQTVNADMAAILP